MEKEKTVQPAIRTVKGREIPEDWKKGLNVDDDTIVEISISIVESRSEEEKNRLLSVLNNIKPVKGKGDSTDIIREYRDRIDTRNDEK